MYCYRWIKLKLINNINRLPTLHWNKVAELILGQESISGWKVESLRNEQAKTAQIEVTESETKECENTLPPTGASAAESNEDSLPVACNLFGWLQSVFIEAEWKHYGLQYCLIHISDPCTVRICNYISRGLHYKISNSVQCFKNSVAKMEHTKKHKACCKHPNKACNLLQRSLKILQKENLIN